ncbi:MAG: WalW protein [Planctomycetes bacterium]|nr:WalW protein [Planctomycetota bacterium]
MMAEREEARAPGDLAPQLLVVLDTEEEFDWNAPFDRDARSVEAMEDIGAFQELCDEFGIRPTYVIDHPVASQERGQRLLREYAADGRAVIGAHLHPWVSPPFEEGVTSVSSYPGNLPRELEARKLEALTETIEEHFGRRPTIYKAGRYGFGPHTTTLLERLGYEIDLSACPAFDLTADGGPDWSRWSAAPYWFGGGRHLLGIPTTGAFVGWLSKAGPALHSAAGRPPLSWIRSGALLSRSGAVERLMLSPEGYEPAHHLRLTAALLARGVRVFSFSLHSPSLRPGCTPYVRSQAQLERFIRSCRQYFEWFLERLGGEATTPGELRERLDTHRTEPSQPPTKA